MKNIFLSFCLSFISLMAFSADRFIVFKPTGDCFPLATDGKPCPIIIDADEDPGVKMAVDNLQQDIFSVCGTKPEISTHVNSRYAVLVGTYRSPLIQRLLSSGKLNKKELEGKREKYLLQTVSSPCDGVEKALVIAGSDKRGAIYGIYELSGQIGVSPWYWWADVPVHKHKHIYIKPGIYTDGEPKVEYRGIFINDEWP